VGKVVDKGIKDPNDMGAAMAPAAADTLVQHFRDFAKSPQDYDLIVTGDLGNVGLNIAKELLAKEGFETGDRFTDCGVLVYDKKQDIHSGGSGCGCSAVVFSAHLYGLLREKKVRRVLLAATGALLSPLTYQQAESIPGICHAIAIEVY
jgi:stage V sporulation protein AD